MRGGLHISDRVSAKEKEKEGAAFLSEEKERPPFVSEVSVSVTEGSQAHRHTYLPCASVGLGKANMESSHTESIESSTATNIFLQYLEEEFGGEISMQALEAAKFARPAFETCEDSTLQALVTASSTLLHVLNSELIEAFGAYCVSLFSRTQERVGYLLSP